ncbi:MAG: elongation factor 4 [Candidatus Margulisiibacteriota bacterium]|nr:MAG: elongation factor 4 [Candidatus Margulisbacteria bacterium GWD2_39_127]OGI01569.1 MAG: elongation factor 4 [Candidatus Margulisbacteria bacterium GWF2_38_17]OGI10011.1 MAG: elongation factor 4 [Candidatus Margulisbacteria bacterium GWE2_39_32]PZM78266.1 MAG: elongation factor 4 [Candidatus Margulisiibacteriota bacterium]HAR61846.1 elongation factor 4 [Candidatus Margulisiibacteriota bacterium]
MDYNNLKIRNFSIIAHIDHGKSTLADRFLEVTNTIPQRSMKKQVLDMMDLEQERGITIKLQAARILFTAKDGEQYVLNLIDTPGHVDFSYEVSRSLAACEGALLVVDAAQGIEAQTLANTYLAMEHDLTLIPVINKIDLPNADPNKVIGELVDILGIDPEEAVLCSAKEGTGITDILQAIVDRIAPPKNLVAEPTKALIFDSLYDPYKGVIIYCRIFEGSISPKDIIKMMRTGYEYEVIEVGVFTPYMTPSSSLKAGEVGYIVAGIRDVRHARVGDTITCKNNPANEALQGYREAKSMVFCGFYPIVGEDYGLLKDAIEKLQLNDAALHFEPETSKALGFGFRCGFLGLLHLEIVQERLEREFNLTIIATAPSVVYKVIKTNGDIVLVDNPINLPEPTEIEHIEEPYVKSTIILPNDYVGSVMELAQQRRGHLTNMEYLTATRVVLHYDLPLNEIITDFYDRLKSISRGYASFDYEVGDYKEADLVKLDVMLNNEVVDALSTIIHESSAYYKGRELTKKLKEIIPRQMFEIPIQAAVGNKIIARETVKAIRKNVLAKCYGGDISRKRKLLEKQKEGKKRMKNIGTVEVPQEAFFAILQINK